MIKKDKNKNEEKETTEEEIITAAEEGSAEAAKEGSTEDPRDKEISSLKDQLLRNMAEYDNYRKRTSRERIELEPEIAARIVGEFLPVADNIERALKTECTDENYKKGIEMVYTAFTETLKKLGVEEIETENADFNPSLHQAVQQIQSDGESGKIAGTFQKGYKIGDKVLRFAMVAVTA